MNISFAYPFVLILLVVPLTLLAWTWRRSGRRVALPFDHGRQRRGRRWFTLVNLAESLPALILAVVLLLLAGPQRFSAPRTQRVLTNIEFCVDISGSMIAPFGDGSRYDASMQAINDFLDVRQGDAYGLTFFGNSVLHWTPLTSDPSAIRCSVPFLRPENAPPWFGGTMIAKALLACKDVLARREEGDRMIILVSDGFSFDLTNGNDEKVAQALRAENIVLYAIHAAEEEIPAEVINVAAYTGGQAFEADDTEALRAVFERIDAMQETRLERTSPETMDNFPPYCVAALSILGACGGAMFGLRYTPW
ncbi:hypothetical protein BH23PLA1_BH23PLA1_36960 [soil metagenome]